MNQSIASYTNCASSDVDEASQQFVYDLRETTRLSGYDIEDYLNEEEPVSHSFNPSKKM